MTYDRPIWEYAAEDVYGAQATAADGLSDQEAATRLKQYGPNEVPEPPRRPLLLRFADQLTHLMALLLWVAGALAFLSHIPELGWSIWAVILINGSFSFWQEYKAERTLAELRSMMPAGARVLRSGRQAIVPARDLVPGDVILLEAGDRVSADARVIAAATLFVDLSLLTGESMPAARHADPLPDEGHLRRPEMTNLVFAGTTVASGRGVAVVYATGTRTEFGEVTHLTASVRREPSTLETQIARIVRVISALAVGMGAIVFVLAYALVGLDLKESMIFAIGIIVANVPEGLLPTVTLSLAMGVQRMARRNALVRRLSAVETLSAATVICTDKTGTLTKNELTVRALWVPSEVVEVTGVGYALEGLVRVRDASASSRQVRLLLACAALCSNAQLAPPRAPRGSPVIGDPTEGALLVAAFKAGLRPDELRREAPRVREVPFDARRRMMSVLVQWTLPDVFATEAPYVACTKGAPLEVLERCRWIWRDGRRSDLTAAARAEARAVNDSFAAEGYRVLGVAMRPASLDDQRAPPETLESDLTFLGLAALADPPRPEIPSALALCRRAGIAVTMVTGDYALTAEAVARKVGLINGAATVVTDREMEALSDEELCRLLRERAGLIFARVTPQQKLRLVQGYKALGHVVVVTGDGANDAPALRAAHIGIAMGISGTDVAREAADVVLVDDNFATIVDAVEQGRAVYLNLRKFVTYILASNVPEIVPFVAMVACKIPPALNIMQILAVDLGTDMVPALALGAERPEAGVMNRPPRPKHQPLVDLPLLTRAYGFLGLIEAAVSMAGFFWVWSSQGYGLAEIQRATPLILARAADPSTLALYELATTVTLCAIVVSQVGNVFASRSERTSAFGLGFFSNPLIWFGIAVEVALLLAVVYLPALQAVFNTAPLPIAFWPVLMVCAPLLLFADELRKLSRRLRRQSDEHPDAAQGARPL